MKPKRILYFSRDYTTHDRRFLETLSARGYEMHFLRLENDGHVYESRPLPDGVCTVEWSGGDAPAPDPRDWLRLLPDLAEVIATVKPELIHAGPVPSCAYMTAMLDSHPLLAASWGSDLLVDAEQDAQRRAFAQYALARADAFLCDATAVKVKAQSLCSIGDDRIVQFPWGIDLECFVPGTQDVALRDGLGWRDCRVMLSTRTWDALYGIDVLLEAFRQAAEADATLRLLMLGGGPGHDSVMGFLKRHGLTDRVHCPGRVDQDALPAYYQAADVYVSCTHSDGVSISLLEALATGLPVVVTDIAGNREWVQHGVNGWLAEDSRPDSFAAAVMEAAHLSADARKAMRDANRAVAAARADWNKNVSLLTHAYDRLIG